MSGVEVFCPSCGAPIHFKIGSAVVTVCPYCSSVVARGDRRPEDLGKVAAIVATGSRLELGMRGDYQGRNFEVVGHVQWSHPAGGLWNEWYVAFTEPGTSGTSVSGASVSGTSVSGTSVSGTSVSGRSVSGSSDRWGWIAEAQGRMSITFELAPDTQHPWLSFDELAADGSVTLPNGWVSRVTEKAVAQAAAAAGEIPYEFTPGQRYAYADIAGPNRVFGTLDYTEFLQDRRAAPRLFLGREVTAEQLHLPERSDGSLPEVSAIQLACPHCGGSLDLQAPDRSERVACPNCQSLLDVNQGKLQYLNTPENAGYQPKIALGKVGRLPEGEMTVIAYLRRAVLIAGTLQYPWDEYLLYQRDVGFRWLTCSDGHWNYVSSVPLSYVRSAGRQKVSYAGQTFRLFQKDPAVVVAVVGECYWKVEIGEVVEAADYVCPPLMLSRERTHSTDDSSGAVLDEVNWSLGKYLTRSEVAKAFDIKVNYLPKPKGISPNQPFPVEGIYSTCGWLTAIAAVLFFFCQLISPNQQILNQQLLFGSLVGGNSGEMLTETFELRGWRNICVSSRTSLSNSTVILAGDLLNEKNQTVRSFGLEMSHYSGVEPGGQRWDENDESARTYMRAVPPGQYTLRLSLYPRPSQRPATVSFQVRQGVAHLAYFGLSLMIIWLVALGVVLAHWWFHANRWHNSDYNS